MGSYLQTCQPKHQQIFFPKYKWKKFQIENQTRKQLYINQTSQNQHDKQIAEKHIFQFSTEQDPLVLTQQQQLKLYFYRFQNRHRSIVGIYEAKTQFKIPGSKYKNLVVYQEYIPYRLSDIRNLTNLQGIYVFQEALKGFRLLYEKFGYFHIDQHMIGFNYKGEVKVWFNKVFYSNKFLGIDQMAIKRKQYVPFYAQPQKKRKTHTKNKYTVSHQLSTIQQQNQNQYQFQQEQENMVTRLWVCVQKYSLFHKDLLDLTKGFYRCNFLMALELIQRYKCNLININFCNIRPIHYQQTPSSIKFVSSLTFTQIQSKNKQNLKFYHNNLNLLQEQLNQEDEANDKDLTNVQKVKQLPIIKKLYSSIKMLTKQNKPQEEIDLKSVFPAFQKDRPKIFPYPESPRISFVIPSTNRSF